ncbi:MAG: hypothetical protein WCA29_03320 [Jiangellales bacterium]
MSAGDDLLRTATDVRADAVRHLTALAGNASMCAIGRSGRSFPAAKYHEGRQSAAGDVRRVLRRGLVDVDGAVADVRRQWQQTLADADAKGPDWVAYATGGLDALAEITAPNA